MVSLYPTVHGWSALGSGTNGSAFGLAVKGIDFYTVGYFPESRGKPSLYHARSMGPQRSVQWRYRHDT